MTKKIFVTGTDTGIGKTYITTQLLSWLTQQGLSTLGVKPIASGDAEWIDGVFMNSDALALKQASSIQLPYESINPICLEKPIAPHIAAVQSGVELSIAILNQKLKTVLDYPADITLIEGAGGWLTPLNDSESYADFVVQNAFPVIMVVGIRLGCINHAMLTYKTLLAMNVRVIGWVANFSTDSEVLEVDAVLDTLKRSIKVPMLGMAAHGKPMEMSEHVLSFF